MEFTFDVGEVLQLVIQVVITVLLPVLLAFSIGAMRSWWVKIKAQIPAEQYAFASSIISQLVLAAEQSGLAGIISNESQEKKQWVIQRAEEELAKVGIILDLNTIADMIEAAVKSELNKSKELPEG